MIFLINQKLFTTKYHEKNWNCYKQNQCINMITLKSGSSNRKYI